MELVAACLPILVWAPLLRGCVVTVLSDNTQTVAFLKRGTTKNLSALEWLKLVSYAFLRFDFRVSAAHCPGIDNTAADALSRMTEAQSHTTRFLTAFKSTFPGPNLPDLSLCSYPRSGSPPSNPPEVSHGRVIEENQIVPVEPFQGLL